MNYNKISKNSDNMIVDIEDIGTTKNIKTSSTTPSTPSTSSTTPSTSSTTPNVEKAKFCDKTIEFLNGLLSNVNNNHTSKDIDKIILKLRKQYHYSPNKTQLSSAYSFMLSKNMIEPNETVRQYVKAKEMRGLSGVIVISVITSPYPQYLDVNGNVKVQSFSCKHDCHYCPREVDNNGRELNARSYLSDEPTVARGLRLGYDPIAQFNDRAQQYNRNGHYVDKIEIIVLGGTWTEYPREYQESYIRDVFYSANIFYEQNDRGKLSLVEEQKINENSKSRIIGLTLEMRPDSITHEEISWLRFLGCTRVQLGVQHIDDSILKKVNRGCYKVDTERALKLLKDSGYKVDAHWMPDLPGSSPEKDIKMFDEILKSQWLQFDQWKIYPTAVVPWTRIKKWYDEGKYVPYTDKNPEDLIKVLIHVKQRVPEWIRLNRVVRDIPNTTMAGETYIYGGNKVTNLRQILAQRMHKKGLFCKCIRCREVGNQTNMFNNAIIVYRDYKASGGHEYFISIESGSSCSSHFDNVKKKWFFGYEEEPGIIYGFIRIRLNQSDNIKYPMGNKYFPNLQNAAFIRELHVYGQVATNSKIDTRKDNTTQHHGVGKILLSIAEKLAYKNNYKQVAVISGIGVKNYYRRHGYVELDTFMVKNIQYIYCGQYQWVTILIFTIILVCVLVI
jgi:ELP3 family radical SAM enzyme/protein acetyltransferase